MAACTPKVANVHTSDSGMKKGGRRSLSPLPVGWEETKDPASGKTYYFHRASGRTTWDRPRHETKSSLPPDWEEIVDQNSGRLYYYNRITKKTTWDRPTGKTVAARNRRKQKRKRKINPWIYISGFDNDIDASTVVEIFSKYGIIDEDILTGEPVVKVYRDEAGVPKGDASVRFAKEPSVELSIMMMDQVEYKPGFPIRVSRAEWTKGGDDSSGEGREKKLPRRWELEITAEEYKKRIQAKRKRQRERLGWRSTSTQKIVVLKNVFDSASELDVVRLKEDMRKGASEFGILERVTIAEHNPDGVVILRYKSGDAVLSCVEKMNGRFYGKRKLSAEVWDGYTNYVCEESAASKKRREEKFGKWLEHRDDKTKATKTTATMTKATIATNSVTRERTEHPLSGSNALEAYVDSIMAMLMDESSSLSKSRTSDITKELDDTMEWICDNRSALSDASLVERKRAELERKIGPLLRS